MRKAMLLLAVIGLTSSLWAADNPIIGTWKLNPAKSKLPASAAKTKEQTTVFREINADTVEGTSTITQIDGTTSVAKWTVPSNGGILTYQQGGPTVEGLLIIATWIDPYTTHNTYIMKGKQVYLMRSKISQDCKSFTTIVPGTDEQKKPVEYIYAFDKQ